MKIDTWRNRSAMGGSAAVKHFLTVGTSYQIQTQIRSHCALQIYIINNTKDQVHPDHPDLLGIVIFMLIVLWSRPHEDKSVRTEWEVWDGLCW